MPRKKAISRIETFNKLIKLGKTSEKDILNLKIEDLIEITEDEYVQECIDIIKKECGKRQKITINMPYISGAAMMNYATMPTTVEVGGATIFVTNVEHFEKI